MLSTALLLMLVGTIQSSLQISVGLHILQHTRVKMEVLDVQAEAVVNQKLVRSSRKLIGLALFIAFLSATGIYGL